MSGHQGAHLGQGRAQAGSEHPLSALSSTHLHCPDRPPFPKRAALLSCEEAETECKLRAREKT